MLSFNKGGSPWSDWEALCCLLSIEMGMEERVASEGLLEIELVCSSVLLAGDVSHHLHNSLWPDDLSLRWGSG